MSEISPECGSRNIKILRFVGMLPQPDSQCGNCGERFLGKYKEFKGLKQAIENGNLKIIKQQIEEGL